MAMVFEHLSSAVGLPVSSLIFLAGILSGFPSALIYRSLLRRKGVPVSVRHAYQAASGLLVGYACFGFDAMKLIWLDSCITYILLVALSKVSAPQRALRLALVLFSVLFNFAYLLWLLVCFQTESYDIDFLMPQSILTLKYIGLSIDVYDGKRKTRESFPQALEGVLSVLEFCSFSFSLNGLFVGPVCSWKEYDAYVRQHAGELSLLLIGSSGRESDSHVNRHYDRKALRKLALGVLYLGLFQVSAVYFPPSLCLDQAFMAYPFLVRWLLIVVVAKLTLYRYFGVWLLVESFGLVGRFVFFRDVEKERAALRQDQTQRSNLNSSPSHPAAPKQAAELVVPFDAIKVKTRCSFPESVLCNIKPKVIETASELRTVVLGFNLNTNAWAKYYIYKRLMFLGNKSVSAIATLLFLCVWHGYHFGYYFSFTLEFVFLQTEAALVRLLAMPRPCSLLPSLVVRILSFIYYSPVVKYVWFQISFLFFFMSFELMSFAKYWQLLQTVYGAPLVAFFAWSACICFLESWLSASSGYKRSSLQPEHKKD